MYNLLIVDDEKIERDGIKMLIKKFCLPLNVMEASNGKEALKILKDAPIDILFTDIVMPFMDGLELAQHAKEIYPELKVIIYSAYGEFEYAKKAIDVSVIQYILKPIDISEFREVMNKVIKKCMEYEEKLNEQNRLIQGYQEAINYEKKKMLIRMIYNENATSGYGDDVSKLKTYFENKFIQLVLLDFDEKFFDTNNEVFEDFLKGVLHFEYYCINLNERQSMIFLVSEKLCEKSELYNLWNNISEFISEKFSLRFFAVFGGCTNKVENLYYEYAKIEHMLEYKFYLEKSSALFTDNQYLNLNLPSITVENLIEAIYRDIDLNEYHNFDKDMELLSEYFKNNDNLSIIYVKYIFSDILKRLMEKNQSGDGLKIKEYIESIFQSRNILQLKETIQKAVDEINSPAAETNDGLNRWLIRDVLKIIENEYMNDIGLGYIAEKVNISPSYLSYVFKKEIGHNLVKYINQFRLEKSKEMLLDTNYKIVDIGQKVGFVNKSYFCFLFKNHYGMTPGEYREKVKTGEKSSVLF